MEVTLATLREEAHRYTRTLSPDASRATLITFSGDLGAGKTTFVQEILRALGVTEHVTSPTFVIQKRYPLTHHVFAQAVHIDAYRLHDPHELEVLGWKELISDPSVLILLEWPEKVSTIIPDSAHRVTIGHFTDETRELTYEKN